MFSRLFKSILKKPFYYDTRFKYITVISNHEGSLIPIDVSLKCIKQNCRTI